MDSTVAIEYMEQIHVIAAHKIDNKNFTTLDELAIIFGDKQTPVRSFLENNGKAVDWDSVSGTIIVQDHYPQGLTKREFDYAARLVQAEAGGEDMKGMILIVNVLMNRVRSNCHDFRHINTIMEAIYQPNQFQPMRDGSFKRAVANDKAREAVRRALNGEDYSQGATFFRRAKDKYGTWHMNSLRHLFTHGGHAFFVPH